MALILAFRCSLFIFLNFSNSLSSAANACTTDIPVRCSCTKALRLATAFLTLKKERLILFLKYQVAIIIIGKGINAINVSCQSIQNITPSTQKIESKSAMIGTNPSEKISLIDSMSLIVLVVNVPMGVLSNCERLSDIIFLYVATLKSFTTDCPSKAVVNENKKRMAVSTSISPI